MPDDEKPIADQSIESAPPEASASEQQGEDEMGEFIARHVLEKDAVFFEG